MRRSIKPYVLVIIVLVLFAGTGYGQTDSTRVIFPGETREINAGNDTLWILSNRQMNKAITKAEKAKLLDSCIQKNEALNVLHDSIVTEKDSIINDYKTGYDRYAKKWEVCDTTLEDKKVELVKAKQKQRTIGVISGGTGAIITAILFLVL